MVFKRVHAHTLNFVQYWDCTSIVPSYRSLFLCRALPFLSNMNVAIQLGRVPQALLVSSSRSTEAASSGTRKANKSLIATIPRLEIVVTYSFERRKHFLTATRNGYSHSKVVSIRIAEVAKINRKPKLLEPPVSYSKQRTEPQINRKLSGDSFGHAFQVSPLTNHYSPLTNEPLRPASQSAKICRTFAQSH
jgi:hypothetical protein